jgi:glyoxylase-like metal-dependent hydrolase (beta-lactamase superfamily II)
MKKNIVTVLMGIKGVLVIFAITGYLNRKMHFRSMCPISSQKLSLDVWALRNDFVNAYILKANDTKLIAVDAGLSEESIISEMKKVSLDPMNVQWVFLTHTDYDHVGGVTAFKNATVYILNEETVMCNGKTVRAPFMKNKLPVPFTTVHDREVVMCDSIAVEPLALLGHTKGHTAYLVNNWHLFTGDAIRIRDNRAEVFIPDFNMNTVELKKSINKLLNFVHDGKTIYTGHFGFGQATDLLGSGISK